MSVHNTNTVMVSHKCHNVPVWSQIVVYLILDVGQGSLPAKQIPRAGLPQPLTINVLIKDLKNKKDFIQVHLMCKVIRKTTKCASDGRYSVA